MTLGPLPLVSTMKSTDFYEVLPDGRYRFRVDHHLISDYNKCDRYFDFRHVPDQDGLVYAPKGEFIKMAIGSWWHSVMESLYHEMFMGRLPSDMDMFKIATEEWLACSQHTPCKKTDVCTHNMDRFKTIDPEYYESFGGVDGGRVMALEYRQAFGEHHFKHWTTIGTETGFGWRDELYLGEDDRVVVYYGGKIDLPILDKVQSMIMPVDFKCTDRVPYNASLKYKPHPQTAGYIFALQEFYKRGSTSLQVSSKEPTKCIVMICARLRPSDKPRKGIRQPRFLPVYPNYTADEIEEWKLSVIEKCRRLRDSIERGVWIPNEQSCHIYNGCAFRRACSVPRAARAATLKADFVKIEPWKPYDVEED